MASANVVVLCGNITRDPVTRQAGGSTVCDLGLAINETWKDKAGQPQERAVFVDVVVWGRTAEICAEHLRKGAPVLVEGKLQLDEWTDKQSGEKRSKLRVRGDRVQFLGQRGDKRGEQSAPPPAQQSKPAADDDIPF